MPEPAQSPRQSPRRKATRTRGSTRIGAMLVSVTAVGLLAACFATPPTIPADPEIPGVEETQPPAFTNLDDPPSSFGPSEPPVPTDSPDTYNLGDTVTLHTAQGSTWEITVTGIIHDDTTAVSSYGNDIPDDKRAVTIELSIENVGVTTTHPYYDMMIAYQPENGPVFDQNNGPLYGDITNDLGYEGLFSPGHSFNGHMSLYVPTNSPEGRVAISGDGQKTFYYWEE